MIADDLPCEEVNECELGTAACSQQCINTDGSYRCQCFDGYHLDGDDHNCLDIDECQIGAPGCWGNCINTLGSYRCKCDIGFKEVMNQTRCADIDECQFQNGGCSNICINTKGSFECRCHSGYVARDPRSFTCVDQNECETSPCDNLCVNTPGSFQCMCDPGYKLVNKTKCVDVDECLTDSQCQQQCTNTPGSYICTCTDGYILAGDKRTCIQAVNGSGCHRVEIGTKSIHENRWSNETREWGWQVQISVQFETLRFPRFNCMGVLVDMAYVLTAANCLRYGGRINIEVERLVLTMGNNDDVIHAKALHVFFHPRIDLALIQLKANVNTTKSIHSICLPQGLYDVDTSVDEKLLAVTWPSNSANLLIQQMFTKITSINNCMWNGRNIYHGDTNICVNFHVEEFTLPMSGSPLLGLLRGTSFDITKQKWILAGLLIRGSAYPSDKPRYEVNVKIAYQRVSSFVDWIRKVTNKRI